MFNSKNNSKMKTKRIVEHLKKFHARILLENVYQRNISPDFYLFAEDFNKFGKIKEDEKFICQLANKIDLALSMLTVTDRVENLQKRWKEIQELYFE